MRRDESRWHRMLNCALFLIRFCALAPYCKPLQILKTVHTVLQYSQTLIKCWKIRGILVFFGGRRQRLLISGLQVQVLHGAIRRAVCESHRV